MTNFQIVIISVCASVVALCALGTIENILTARIRNKNNDKENKNG